MSIKSIATYICLFIYLKSHRASINKPLTGRVRFLWICQLQIINRFSTRHFWFLRIFLFAWSWNGSAIIIILLLFRSGLGIPFQAVAMQRGIMCVAFFLQRHKVESASLPLRNSFNSNYAISRVPGVAVRSSLALCYQFDCFLWDSLEYLQI